MKYAAASRIQTIDIIRGIALFGILVMNIQTYTLFAFLRPEQVYNLGIDHPQTYAPAQYVIHLLFKGQFYTMYSFLFGLGFYLMMEKNKRMGLDGNQLFKRRLMVLFFFGLIHALVLWFGDILHRYALLAFTLFYFNKKSVPALFKWITGLFIYIILFQLGKAIIFPQTHAALATSQQQFDIVIMKVVATWQHGSFMEVLSLQKLGVLMSHVIGVQNGLSGFVHLEIMFLFGLIAGKIDVFNRVSAFRSKLKRIAGVLIVPALLLKAFSCLPVLQRHVLPSSRLSYENVAFSLAEFVATPLLTLVYLIGITLILQNRRNKFFTWIGNTGRLGLTNYLAQTLMCMILFYGYSFGWSGQVTLLQSFAFIIPIYIFQMVYSNLWLRYYQMGPMEKLWRMLIYRNGSEDNSKDEEKKFFSFSNCILKKANCILKRANC